jgi:microcystin-dependent protein
MRAPSSNGQSAGADEVAIESVQVDTRDGTNVTVNSVTRGTRNNGQPALALSYIICVSGIRPSQRD